MGSTPMLNRVHETLAWGAIFVWWGITELFKLPNGLDALGIGLILLGIVALRARHGLSTNGLTVTLGLLALAWGVLDLARSVTHLPLQLSAEFAILLMVLGVTLLGLGLRRAPDGFWGHR